ncbi:MAG TPA: alpha/beta hydrolase family protein, partial [Jatrophihabitantaceae bacterium]|nr:alpha/beta hydrolase family protein [Jatrophihabitantaceae bacterium]
VDDRLWALSVSSPALGRAVRLRVLLPTGYDADAATRYPVLYLFHGTSGGPDDWINAGAAEQTTAGLPLIVVLPDAGFDNNGGGWFTNWVDTATALGPSQWETFHVNQVVPWVDSMLDTVRDRNARAVAGLSQGGFGAMSYAARHPDTFGAVGSFSGAPEIDRDPVVIPFSSLIISGTAFYLDGVEPDAMFGSRFTNEINWQGHDPAMLIDNLHSTDLSMWTATGIPGKYDTAPDLAASGIEAMTHESTQLFHQHLDEAGIPSYLDDYVYGTHTFPYWADDLRAFVPRLMQYFATHAAAPASVTYTSVDKTWTQWGWTVASQRNAAQKFTALGAATPSGFQFTGDDPAVVTTPAAYAPGSAHAVTVSSCGSSKASTVTADAAGRLSMSVAPKVVLGISCGKATVSIA